MEAQTVAETQEVSNGILEEVKTWVRTMGDRGLYPISTSRFRISAIENLTSILGDDEPKTPEWILANIGDIARRWAIKTSANPDTADTYKTRAKKGIEDYLAYQTDPSSFRPQARVATPKTGKPKKEKEPRKDAVTDEEMSARPAAPPPQPSAAPPPSPSTGMGDLRSYPLGGGREFKYALPADGIKVRDLRRIALHLLTLAEDFDPTSPNQASLFAIVKVKEDGE